MDDRIKIIKASDNKVSKWSGGLTTEFYIYPESVNYQNRNFLFRVSSAVVSDERSEFTDLHGYDRILMLLEGELKMFHDKKKEVILSPFEVDCFDGGSETVSVGKCVDFNLIMKKGCKGSVKAFKLNEAKKLSINNNDCYNFFHMYKGETSCQLNNKIYTLKKGDSMVVFQQVHWNDIHIKTFTNDAVIIYCSVYVDK